MRSGTTDTPETVSPINVAEGESGEETPGKEDDDEDGGCERTQAHTGYQHAAA